MPQAVPITFLSRFHPTRGQVLTRVLRRPLFSVRGWARRSSDAMATGRVGKAVGDFTARRRSAQIRFGKTSVLQEAHRVHNAPEDTYEQRRGTWSMRVECAQRYPCSETKRFLNKCITTVKETPLFFVFRPLCRGVFHPHALVETENLKSEK